MAFLFRTNELDTLRNMRWLSEQHHGRLTLITGAPGMGKARLAAQALEGQPCLWVNPSGITDSLLFSSLAAQVGKVLGVELPEYVKNLHDLLNFVFNRGRQCCLSIVVKECQKLNEETRILLRTLWEANRLLCRINLVLTTSDVAYVRWLEEDPSVPLRTVDSRIDLKPLTIAEMKQALEKTSQRSGISGKKEAELALYAVTGGIPSLVERMTGVATCDKNDIISVAVAPNSHLRSFWSGHLMALLGKNSETYLSALTAIALGKSSQTEIETVVGCGNLGGHLARLEQDYGLITRKRPAFSDIKSRGVVRYSIVNPSLVFWLSFCFSLDHKGYSPKEATAYALLCWNDFSHNMLCRYFRQRFVEEDGFTAAEAWWEPALKDSFPGNIDVVAWKGMNKKILVAGVCRDEDSFNSEYFVKSVTRFKGKTRHHSVDARLFTLNDI